MVTTLAFSLYTINLAVGLVAQIGRVGFGRFHHVLYGLVFVAAAFATVLEFHPGLLVTFLALAAFPKARPRTFWHPALAILGLLGYLATFL